MNLEVNQLTKKITSILLCVLLIGLFTGVCKAESSLNRREYAFGWQFSRPTSGLSVKIPLQEQYYIQPIFALSLSDQNEATDGYFSFGVRGIWDLPTRDDLHPYAGVAWGYAEDFNGKNVKNSTVSKAARGFQSFFGVEYQKFLLRPAVEIGLGSFRNNDGSYFAGVTYNFSLLYYF